MPDVASALAALDLAECAYVFARDSAATLPEGWELVGPIETEPAMDLPVYADAGIFGFVAKRGDDAMVAIRGTQNRVEWLADFDFLSKLYDLAGTRMKARVHGGFLKTYSAIRKSIFENLEKSGCSAVAVTGHSLGSGLATLAAFELSVSRVPLLPSYVFASPRVGFRAFVDEFDAAIPEFHRVVNWWDVVCDAPSALLGYYHVGHSTGLLVDGGGPIEAHHRHMLASYRAGLGLLSPLAWRAVE